MLAQLTIKNFSLIDHVHLDFTQHLNVLTGETGAGKSILIDALRFVLGEKIQTFQMRDADKECVVQAVFELTNDFVQQDVFEDLLPDGEPTLILQRSLNKENRSRAKINGLTVTVTQLKNIGAILLDLHGPHDHQHLLADHNHITMIDQLTNFKQDFSDYTALFTEWHALKKKKDNLRNMSVNRERDLDMLKHQITELKHVELTSEALEEVENEHGKITNAEKLFGNIQEVLQLFDNEEAGLDRQLSAAFRPMQNIAQTDENFSSLLYQLETLQDNAQQLLHDLRRYADSLQFDPAYAQEVSTKFNAYQAILAKYGPSIDDAKTFYEEALAKFETLDDLDHNDEALTKKITAAQRDLKQLAKRLTDRRKKTAALLKKTIEAELKELGFSHILFDAVIDSDDFSSTGADRVTFYISPNAGEALKPLAQIVSSGEAARIMLALKKALVKVDPVPVLIFDEIDAQIGGRLGTITGTKLRDIANERQVILISHLPQIASFAETHYKITKDTVDGRATTQARALSCDERVDELAQMMSGSKQSNISRTHAEEMLTQAQE